MLREVTSHLLLHDKRSLWLTNSDMYAKRDLKPHPSEKSRVWFVETALKDLWKADPAYSIMLSVTFFDGEDVLLMFEEGVCSVELCKLTRCYDRDHIPTGKYGRFFLRAPTVLASRSTQSKKQVLLWFAATPDDHETTVHMHKLQQDP